MFVDSSFTRKCTPMSRCGARLVANTAPVPVAVVLSASRSIPALVSMSSMVSRAASLPAPGECVTVLPSGRLMMSSAGGSAKPNAAVTVKDRSTASDSGLATKASRTLDVASVHVLNSVPSLPGQVRVIVFCRKWVLTHRLFASFCVNSLASSRTHCGSA